MVKSDQINLSDFQKKKRRTLTLNDNISKVISEKLRDLNLLERLINYKPPQNINYYLIMI